MVGSSLILLERLNCPLVGPEPVEPAAENVDNGEEVVDELGLGTRSLLIEDHEAATVSVAQVLEEVEAEATEPIPVGNHNLLDSSAADSVHQGEESPPSEVDPGPDVGDDLVPWTGLEEGPLLALEVLLLLGGADSAVDDPSPSLPRLDGRLRVGRLGSDTGDVIPAVASGGPDASDGPCPVPGTQGLDPDAESSGGGGSGKQLVHAAIHVALGRKCAPSGRA